MSWVADVKATSQNAANDSWKKKDVGSENAIQAKPMAMINCMEIVHQRLVFIKSTKGLQKGLMTHGK